MRFSTFAVLFAALAALAVPQGAHAQRSEAALRSSFGFSVLGLAPRGEFANNVDFALGVGGHYMFALDPARIVALRVDLGFLNYGSERYRTPLGGGPLGLINVEVTTNNNIALGGLGLQIATPGGTVRPYANASAGFSYFFTESSVKGLNNNGDDAFASSTNYSDGGFAWTVGGGLYIPVSVKRRVVNIDLGARYLDNGSRNYLRDDGITFENGVVDLHPVRSDAKGIQFNLGVAISFR